MNKSSGWRATLLLMILLGAGLSFIDSFGSIEDTPTAVGRTSAWNSEASLIAAVIVPHADVPIIQANSCENTGESYGSLAIPNWVSPTLPAEIHPDINLAVRGYTPTIALLSLVDLGNTDPSGPQLAGLYAIPHLANFTAAYQVFGWDWGNNRRGDPMSDWEVTMLELAATPGETVHVPDRNGSDIGNGYKALVLYASSDQMTIKYTSEDAMVTGYGLHLENICVDSNLLALYQQLNVAGRHQLPALQARQAVGRVPGTQFGVAVRDTGMFMDPRSRYDWWRGLTPGSFSVNGRVLDGSGNPIFAVTVSAGSGGNAFTDSSGYYTITSLITGTYTLTPIKSGYTFSPPWRTVSVPPHVTGQDFTGYIALTDVTITGPTAGTVNTAYTFTATVSPVTATTPVTYVWQATEQPTVTHTGGVSDTVNFAWSATSAQAITVTTTNASGTVTGTHTIALGLDALIAPPGGVLVYTDTQGSPTMIAFPAGAVTQSMTFIYTPVPIVTAPSGLAFAGHAFDLSAYRDGALVAGFTFAVPITVTLRYQDADVAGMDESSLRLYYWNGSAWADAACGAYDRDVASNQISVSLCHLSEFALLGTAPLPPGVTPLTGMTINGPTEGLVNTTYAFSTTVSPVTVTTPITYMWTPEPMEGQGKSRATYAWTAAGPKTITITAQNAGGVATATHIITLTTPPNPCPTPLSAVTLLGPATGFTGTAYAFTAIVTPAGATLPFTYTWTPAPPDGQSAAVVTYTWDAVGVYSITASAANCGATVRDTQTIEIKPLPPQASGGDAYEPDNACAQARSVAVNGAVQAHTFHAYADEDWAVFTATAGITYVIQASVPPTSPADVRLEVYQGCGPSQDAPDQSFGPDVRLTFRAATSGAYTLRLRNNPPSVYGSEVGYRLSVRALGSENASGALVLVAGKRRDDDPLQANIYNVTNAAYRLARTRGCGPDQIYYLAADVGLPGVNDLALTSTLKYALTQWAVDKVGPNRPLTLFMMDHGGHDELYLNGSEQKVTPDQLDEWIDELEAQTGAAVNVVVEACNSGSFIDPDKSVSRAGRVVVASTSAQAPAYASQSGAVFSEAFLAALNQGLTLRDAFQDAAWTAGQAHLDQTPGLDDNGNGQPNEAGDGELAAQRGFACATVASITQSPPHIARAEVRRVQLDKGKGEIWAEVRDDREVKRAWAVVYPPSYTPPAPGSEMTSEPLLKLALDDQGNGWYGNLYAGFDEIGEYRVVIYAEDVDGLAGRPKLLTMHTGYKVYLPLVVKR